MVTTFEMPGSTFGEMLTWCIDNFGIAYVNNRWQTYQHSVLDANGITPGRVFIFYDDIDAMAFKLRWVEYV